MNLYPLKLSYFTVSTLWGGKRLIDDYGKSCDFERLSESWELTVREDGRISRIENGCDVGLSLREYINKHGNTVVSDTYDGGRFPILIKLIDANDCLSVQVHPDDDYAYTVENDSGKTEMWYIVDAMPDAKIIYGLADGVSKEDFEKSVGSGDYDSVLNYVDVKKGEHYFIPAGMVHAIGKGILIAEIQQNSDLTYRVYDYDRRDKNGNLRELHIKKALDVIKPFTDADIHAIAYENGEKSEGDYIANSKYFNVRRIALDGKREFCADKKSFNCLLVLDGEAVLDHNETEFKVKRGECWFIPAGAGNYSLNGNAELLVSAI